MHRAETTVKGPRSRVMGSGVRVLGTWVQVGSPRSRVLNPQGLESWVWGHGFKVLGPGLGRRTPEGFAIRRGDFSHLPAGV